MFHIHVCGVRERSEVVMKKRLKLIESLVLLKGYVRKR
jgi:hypothetical protein